MAELTSEVVNLLLRHDPMTGLLFWRERPLSMFPCERTGKIWNTRYANKEAFISTAWHGYRSGCLFNKRYSAHRLIWFMHMGSWPDGQIDHVNGIRTDNRIENLRVVSSAENARNAAMRSNNTSGVNGVQQSRSGKWNAFIRVDGKTRHLGRFSTLEEATAARLSANAIYGFSERHGASS